MSDGQHLALGLILATYALRFALADDGGQSRIASLWQAITGNAQVGSGIVNSTSGGVGNSLGSTASGKL